jgi:histidinol dehydrogenase
LKDMVIGKIFADGKAEQRFLKRLSDRAGEVDEATTKIVAEIINNVRSQGDKALFKYMNIFDGGVPEKLEVSKEEMRQAFTQADPKFCQALQRAKANIEQYHKKQVQKDYRIEKDDGIVLGQMIRGLERVGIYVPGGTAAYPSTVLMNAIPAKIAGVEEIIMVTPPHVREVEGQTVYAANPDILAAAYISGVDRVFLAGGAQAIAALTFGTDTIPAVDKIVGPGNIFVATAKRLLYGRVDIDMIAGPSEILIIADETADPVYVAADLMSQAEHDTMSAAILLTDSVRLADEVEKELSRQVALMERKDIICKSMRDYGGIIICKDEDEMVRISDYIAPEHLEIMTRTPMDLLKSVKNAGSVFCGQYTPEPLGDYYSGTNHVLPTSGTARFSSPLGVYSFIKKISYTYYTEEALSKAARDIMEIAHKEGLTAHANSIKVRLKG